MTTTPSREIAAHNWYVEPQKATDALLSVERFEGACWDPCAGQGHIPMTLREHGLPAIGSDLIERAPGAEWFVGRRNFYETLWPRSPAPNIISNPPYFRGHGVEDFIRKSMAIPGVEKLAVFVDCRFLYSERRAYGLFRDFPPARVWIIVPRVSCPPGELLAAGLIKPEGGAQDFAWMIWDVGAPPSPPILGWACGGLAR